MYIKRTVDGLPWSEVAACVENRRGGHPSERQCREVVKTFKVGRGRRVYKYHRCGHWGRGVGEGCCATPFFSPLPFALPLMETTHNECGLPIANMLSLFDK